MSQRPENQKLVDAAKLALPWFEGDEKSFPWAPRANGYIRWSVVADRIKNALREALEGAA